MFVILLIHNSASNLSVMPLNRYYKLLGLDSSASSAEVKRAFRKRAFELHPDHNSAPDAPQRFMAVQQAYQIIENYHRTGHRPKTEAELFAESVLYRKQQTRNRRRRKPTAQEYQHAYERKQREKSMYDQQIYRKVYERYNKGWRLRLHIVLAAIGLLLALFVIFDFAQPPQAEQVFAVHGEYIDSANGGWIYIDGFKHLVDRRIYYTAVYKRPLIVYRSRVFKDVVRIRTEYRDEIVDEFLAGMISLGPMTAIFFFLPFLGFWYRRPDFVYTFYFIHYTMYAAPVLYVFFCFSDARIFRAFGMW